ncbi:unnamed protein product [Amoebophrya sp. A25]|nr:unnamed protein product [Amoebophrya sp. A25]|eukprot:GSA25T00009971001.1
MQMMIISGLGLSKRWFLSHASCVIFGLVICSSCLWQGCNASSIRGKWIRARGSRHEHLGTRRFFDRASTERTKDVLGTNRDATLATRRGVSCVLNEDPLTRGGGKREMHSGSTSREQQRRVAASIRAAGMRCTTKSFGRRRRGGFLNRLKRSTRSLRFRSGVSLCSVATSEDGRPLGDEIITTHDARELPRSHMDDRVCQQRNEPPRVLQPIRSGSKTGEPGTPTRTAALGAPTRAPFSFGPQVKSPCDGTPVLDTDLAVVVSDQVSINAPIPPNTSGSPRGTVTEMQPGYQDERYQGADGESETTQAELDTACGVAAAYFPFGQADCPALASSEAEAQPCCTRTSLLLVPGSSCTGYAIPSSAERASCVAVLAQKFSHPPSKVQRAVAVGTAVLQDLVPPALLAGAAYALTAYAGNALVEAMDSAQPELAALAKDAAALWYSSASSTGTTAAVEGATGQILLEGLKLIPFVGPFVESGLKTAAGSATGQWVADTAGWLLARALGREIAAQSGKSLVMEASTRLLQFARATLVPFLAKSAAFCVGGRALFARGCNCCAPSDPRGACPLTTCVGGWCGRSSSNCGALPSVRRQVRHMMLLQPPGRIGQCWTEHARKRERDRLNRAAQEKVPRSRGCTSLELNTSPLVAKIDGDTITTSDLPYDSASLVLSSRDSERNAYRGSSSRHQGSLVRFGGDTRPLLLSTIRASEDSPEELASSSAEAEDGINLQFFPREKKPRAFEETSPRVSQLAIEDAPWELTTKRPRLQREYPSSGAEDNVPVDDVESRMHSRHDGSASSRFSRGGENAMVGSGNLHLSDSCGHSDAPLTESFRSLTIEDESENEHGFYERSKDNMCTDCCTLSMEDNSAATDACSLSADQHVRSLGLPVVEEENLDNYSGITSGTGTTSDMSSSMAAAPEDEGVAAFVDIHGDTAKRELVMGQVVRVVLRNGEYLVNPQPVWLVPSSASSSSEQEKDPVLLYPLLVEYSQSPAAQTDADLFGVSSSTGEIEKTSESDDTVSSTENADSVTTPAFCVDEDIVDEAIDSRLSCSESTQDEFLSLPRPVIAPTSIGGGVYFVVARASALRGLLSEQCWDRTTCLAIQKHLAYTILTYEGRLPSSEIGLDESSEVACEAPGEASNVLSSSEEPDAPE